MALLAAALERYTHRVGMRHAALERLADRGIELCGPIALEQPKQGGGDRSEIVAALGGAQQQSLARRRDLGETVGAAITAGGTLVRDQSLDMRAILDLGALVVAAGMAGKDLGAVDDAHLVRIGEHGERASDLGVGHRVIVEIEPNIGRLADLDGDTLDQRIGVVRQLQQSGRLLGEGLAHA